jgi:hypothetical protein
MIPLHHMQAFILPMATHGHLKVNTKNLWRGMEDSFSNRHYLVAWRTLTLPKEFGGLGLIDAKSDTNSQVALGGYK